MWNPFDFTGKKYIVTGASSGIGRAVAVKLAEQGAQVCLVARNAEKLAETLSLMPGEGHAVSCADLGTECDLEQIFRDATADGKKLDGLVYCAGISKILPAAALNKRIMDESMSVNLYSFAEMAALHSKKKYRAEKSSIVGISSICVQYAQQCQTLYAATKAGMNAMVTSLAIEFAKKNIRINTVMPSVTKTKMMDEAWQDKTPEEIEKQTRTQVLGLIQPEEIANVVLFLLSDAASVITGRGIYADAGYLNFL